MQIQNIITKINEKINKGNYYYISNEIENGLGLEKFIYNFVFVCRGMSDSASLLKRNGKKVIVIDLNDAKSSSDLLNILNKIDSNKLSAEDYFQTFKISPQFERSVQTIGGKLINTSAAVNRLFEGKISQTRIFQEIGISMPKTILRTLENLEFNELATELGVKFVLQFDRGHTGLGTIFVESAKQFEEIKMKFPKRQCRISQIITGDTYTVNGCITKKGICLAGLNKQITGIDELTSEKGGTVGNEFDHQLSTQIIEELHNEVTKLFPILKANNYKGLIGFDFMVDENKQIKIIEINARQPRSVPFTSKLQVMRNEIPLNLLHVSEFLNVDYSINCFEYSLKNCMAEEAAQIFVRNISGKETSIITEYRNGEYKINQNDQIDYVKEAITIDQIDEGNKQEINSVRNERKESRSILVLTRPNGEIIDHGGEIARIQIKNSAFDGDEINPVYVKVLTELRKTLVG